MSKAIRVLIGAFAIVGVAYAAMLLLLVVSPHMESHCRAYPVMEVPSPTAAYLATVENNTCTPSHELQTTVYVSGGSGPQSSVFIAPAAIRDAGTYSPLPLKLTWLGDAQLQVAYPRSVQAQSRVESVGYVNVVYKQFEGQP